MKWKAEWKWDEERQAWRYDPLDGLGARIFALSIIAANLGAWLYFGIKWLA